MAALTCDSARSKSPRAAFIRIVRESFVGVVFCTLWFCGIISGDAVLPSPPLEAGVVAAGAAEPPQATRKHVSK
jgi:hypothetical protein